MCLCIEKKVRGTSASWDQEGKHQFLFLSIVFLCCKGRWHVSIVPMAKKQL